MRFEVIENVTNEYMTMAIEGSSKATVIVSYKGLGPENHLVSNGPKVTRCLEREVMNEEYLPLDLSNSKYTSMNRLFITERAHILYVWFFLEEEII